MADTLLIERGIGEFRIAVIEDGAAVAFGFEDPDDRLAPGRCHLGRIARLEPALDVAFVDLGGGASGFLSARRLPPDPSGARQAIGRRLFEGQKLLVQVTRGPVGDKSAELTARPELAGLLLVYDPHGNGVTLSRRIADAAERARLEQAVAGLIDGDGFTVRTAAAGATAAALTAEAAALKATWQDLGRAAAQGDSGPLPGGLLDAPVARLLTRWLDPESRRILVDTAADLAAARQFLARFWPALAGAVTLYDGSPPLFAAHGAEAAQEAALEPVVPLSGGGRLIIEATHALTAIDVDSAADTAAGRAINMAAARSIPGELRRRAIGGLVVIDFLRPGGDKAEAEILQTLRAGFDRDPAHIQLGRFSRLGLVDLARQRAGPSLAERLSGPAPAAKRLLRQALAEARASGPGAIEINANPAVQAAIGPEALTELGRRTGRPCRLGPASAGAAGTVAIL